MTPRGHVTPGGDVPLPGATDEAVRAAWKRVGVHDNLDPDEPSEWGQESPDELNAIVGLSAAAVIVELADLPWPPRVEIGVLFGSDDEVADLNARFRDRAGATNVLSFPAQAMAPGEAPPSYLGDLAFAHGVVVAEAREREQPLAAYLPVLAVHGILHLIGHDHETGAEDAEAMERLEARVLARLGLPDPYEGTELA